MKYCGNLLVLSNLFSTIFSLTYSGMIIFLLINVNIIN